MKKIIFILFYLFFILTNITIAKDNNNLNNSNDAIMLDEISVTATRNKELIYKIPANVTIITENEIKKSGAENIPEVLNKKANIHFQSFNGQSSQAKIAMRAFGGDNPHGKVLILLNGKKLNRPDMAGINWLQVPIQQVERIEVIKGSSTVLYGDSAVAGVINIITKKGSKNIESQASIIIGSNDTYIERAGIIGSNKKLNFALNAENYDTNGWRQRTASYSKGGGLNIGYDIKDNLIINFDGSYNKNMYEMPGGLTKAEIKENRKQYKNLLDEAKNEYIDLGLNLEKLTNKFGNFELKFVYGNKDIKLDMTSWPNYNSIDIDTIGFIPKYTLESNIFNLKNNLVLGFDIYKDKLNKDEYNEKERITKIGSAEVKKDSIGFYLRDEISIQEDIIASIGFRKEKVKFKGKEFNTDGSEKFNDNDTFRKNAFELGLTKLFGEKAKIFGKFSTVYRIPFIDEKIDFKKGWLKELKPEKGKSYEIGGSFHPEEKLGFDIAIFNIDMEDTIIYTGLFPNAKNENVGKTKHQGIELSVDYNLDDKIKLFGNYIYNKATFENGDNKDKEVPLVSNNRLSLGSDIYLPYDLSISLSMQYTDESFSDNANIDENKLDSYTVYDFVLRYNPDKKFFNNAKLSAYIGIKNLFDEEYSTFLYYGSYYPSIGRNFIAGISYNF